MVELVNLRTFRKQAKRKQDEARANANRLTHGQPKGARELSTAQGTKASRDLDGHRIDKGDDR